MNDIANNVLFGGAINGNMAGNLQSDWIYIDKNVKDVCIEAIWSGNPNGTFSIQQKIEGSKTISATSTVSQNPNGSSYAGNLDAANLDSESLGTSLITATVMTNRIRLIYTRTGGSGTLRGKLVVKTQ